MLSIPGLLLGDCSGRGHPPGTSVVHSSTSFLFTRAVGFFCFRKPEARDLWLKCVDFSSNCLKSIQVRPLGVYVSTLINNVTPRSLETNLAYPTVIPSSGKSCFTLKLRYLFGHALYLPKLGRHSPLVLTFPWGLRSCPLQSPQSQEGRPLCPGKRKISQPMPSFVLPSSSTPAPPKLFRVFNSPASVDDGGRGS
ncbi:hypothetical protein NDU88_001789 [Pleurodeles waltl]|uniref:Uncharacterized protein n=1 Tax=Pleurodeles waltl TaxID=8319 RepID=A0AAV7M0J2_PLEWA|nr:hypothetical protein NDU88_001789 [Pleurodeles waltl]